MEDKGNPVVNFIAQHWVSWVIEIVIMAIIAYVTIAETRKTAEQTREMLARFEASVAKYASEKSESIDTATANSFDAIKASAKKIDEAMLRSLLNQLQKEQNKASESK